MHTTVRECGSILYLGMAKEIYNLPYWYTNGIIGKELQTPKQACR